MIMSVDQLMGRLSRVEVGDPNQKLVGSLLTHTDELLLDIEREASKQNPDKRLLSLYIRSIEVNLMLMTHRCAGATARRIVTEEYSPLERKYALDRIPMMS